MAPEVIMTGKYGFEADIYSLAIVVWELFHRMYFSFIGVHILTILGGPTLNWVTLGQTFCIKLVVGCDRLFLPMK